MIECHGLDTETQVFFYERDFYVFSNFAAFRLDWAGHRFGTSEEAYHWEKFPGDPQTRFLILNAPSAHAAFKLAEERKALRRPDWNDINPKTGRPIKVDIMKPILQAKAFQHEYVRRKLLATDNRELIEDSWRDNFWGWGPDKNGQNWLGRLWMEIRDEIRRDF